MEWSWSLTIEIGMLAINMFMFCVIKFNDMSHLTKNFNEFKNEVKEGLSKQELKINKMGKDIVAIKVRCYERYRCGRK